MAEQVKITGTIIPASIVADEKGTRIPGQRFALELPLRDLFAAFALAGMLANQRVMGATADKIAKDAYTFADAAIAARETEK